MIRSPATAFMFVPLRTKSLHEVAYACALLNHHHTSYPLRPIASEIVRRGIEIRPPSVSLSSEVCTMEGAAVRIGLSKITGIAQDRVRLLLDRRVRHGPFTDIDDLIRRTTPSHPELESLLFSGACDDLIPDAFESYPFVHQTILDRYLQPPMSQLIRPSPRAEVDHDYAQIERFRSLIRLQNELLFLQMHIHAHPMAVLREAARQIGCVDSTSVNSAAGRSLHFAGVISASRCVVTGLGLMQYVTLEDEQGTVEAVLLPKAYRRFALRVSMPGPFVVIGKTIEEEGDIQMVVARIDPFFQRSGTSPLPRPASSSS